jgi:hypothetical protein
MKQRLSTIDLEVKALRTMWAAQDAQGTAPAATTGTLDELFTGVFRPVCACSDDSLKPCDAAILALLTSEVPDRGRLAGCPNLATKEE